MGDIRYMDIESGTGTAKDVSVKGVRANAASGVSSRRELRRSLLFVDH